MTKTEADRRAAALDAAGVVRDAHTGTLDKAARALRRSHGGRTIEGAGPSGRHAVSACVDVADALTGGWSVEALRACGHTPAARAAAHERALVAERAA